MKITASSQAIFSLPLVLLEHKIINMGKNQQKAIMATIIKTEKPEYSILIIFLILKN